MAYIVKEDLTARLPQGDINQLSDNDDTLLEALIDEACGEIDWYLAGRYSVPLSSIPAIVKTWAMDISVYLLAARAAIPVWKLTEEGERENTIIVKRYNDAIKALKEIRDGNAGLDGIAGKSVIGSVSVDAKKKKFDDIGW